MGTLIMMIGAPGSGKSYTARQIYNLAPERIKIISRDKIRFSLVKEDEPYFLKEKQVFKQFIQEINNSLKNDEFTIVDATNLTKKSRDRVINSLEPCTVSFLWALCVDTSYEDCMRQNNLRSGREKVPASALTQMYDKLSFPKEDEEDFDLITIVRNGDISKFEYIGGILL